MKHTILCVDDEIDNVDTLERLLRRKFTILKAVSGKAALDLLAIHPEVSLIITDQRMPQMTGVELLEKSIATHPESIRILLTGYTDIESIIEAINSGQIFRYLTKPWDPMDLMNSVDQAIVRFELRQQLKQKNIDLEKALEELKSLDQAKNQFMILINHELKTPLTSILSFSELLNESPIPEEEKQYVSRILKSGHRLKNLIDDVLLIVSGETNQLKKNISKVNLKTMCSKWPDEVQLEMTKKNQTVNIPSTESFALMDSAHLQEILFRLVLNAARFGDPGSEIKIQSYCESDQIKIIVENHGPQIPDNVIDKLIKPFTLNENVMHHSKGSGLGLTVCQSILKSYNSFLILENTSMGVRVSFTIPQADR
jgi:signal transduction histidine kinase